MDDNFLNIEIEDNLYSENEDSNSTSELISESKNIWDEINSQFVDKVTRLTIKVQLDGD